MVKQNHSHHLHVLPNPLFNLPEGLNEEYGSNSY